MELRKDYLLDRWTIVASNRDARPKQFVPPKIRKGTVDYFAPGNEHLTPPEIGRIPDGDSWLIRWFPNKFPFVEATGNPKIQEHNEFYTFANSYGYHEVVVETPDDRQLWDMPAVHLTKLLKVYNDRITELSQRPDIQYVVVFKNHGKEAGTSLPHSHTQVTAINHLPTPIKDTCAACKDDDPYARIIEQEKNSDRSCFENEKFVAFTPYASRFNYEIVIFPKAHLTAPHQFTDYEFSQLAAILHQILEKLRELNVPYNFYLQYAPPGENMRFHMEITPRTAIRAGFEFSSDVTVISTSPEDAAAFYRGEL